MAKLNTSIDQYFSDYMENSKAGVGIVLTRTNEPHRLIKHLLPLVYVEGYLYKSWSIITGWQQYYTEDQMGTLKNIQLGQPKLDDKGNEIIDGNTIQIVPAISYTGTDPLPRNAKGTIYIMNYMHYNLSNPVIVEYLKKYAIQFAASGRRLIILAPPGFILPKELENDIPYLDLEEITEDERETTFTTIVNNLRDATKNKVNVTNMLGEGATESLVSLSSGMGTLPYEKAVSMAIREAVKSDKPRETFLKSILAAKAEIVKKTEILEIMPSGDLGDVGGLENLKEYISKRRHCFSEEARDFGVDTPKGIGLIGFPGTGKSLSAKAIAKELDLMLVKFDLSRVFNKYVGSSEDRMRVALKQLEDISPCVVFIDEVDKMFSANEGGGDSGVGKRILGTLLTWMQETTAPVFLVVTANRAANLPSEFVRKGRLDELFCVPLPDESDRLEVLRIHLKKRKQNPDKITDLNLAAEASELYTPAELEAAVKEAIVEAFHSEGKIKVTGALITKYIKEMTPLSTAFPEQYEEMMGWAEKNAKMASRVKETKLKEVKQSRSRSIDIG